eukprot:365325-Chlamydomonas_euryale.AAC.12
MRAVTMHTCHYLHLACSATTTDQSIQAGTSACFHQEIASEDVEDSQTPYLEVHPTDCCTNPIAASWPGAARRPLAPAKVDARVSQSRDAVRHPDPCLLHVAH